MPEPVAHPHTVACLTINYIIVISFAPSPPEQGPWGPPWSLVTRSRA